jgi:hypothetical protein
MDNIIEQFESLVADFTAKADAFIAKAKQAENSKQLPVTGRPFMAGVNEPEEGQEVWYWDTNDFRVVCGSFTSKNRPAVIRIFADLLRRGELYPTEADCIFGEKRREIRARYEAMSDGFEFHGDNWYTYYSHNNKTLIFGSSASLQDGVPVFRTKERSQAAIDAINAEYGAGAFVKYVLGVNENG